MPVVVAGSGAGHRDCGSLNYWTEVRVTGDERDSVEQVPPLFGARSLRASYQVRLGAAGLGRIAAPGSSKPKLIALPECSSGARTPTRDRGRAP